MMMSPSPHCLGKPARQPLVCRADVPASRVAPPSLTLGELPSAGTRLPSLVGWWLSLECLAHCPLCRA